MNAVTSDISVKEARARILSELTPTASEICPFETSYDRVLAEDIIAATNIPPFHSSAMDGFCMAYEDVQNVSPEAPLRLKIIDDIPAGVWRKEPLDHGEAARIATGAPLPIGCDVVVPLEWISGSMKDGAFLPGSHMVLNRSVEGGQYVRPAGQDVLRGTTILRAGQRLKAPDIGMLAGLGIIEVQVYKRPDVALFSTGDELLEASEDLEQGKIRDSNRPALGAAIRSSGCNPIDHGIIADDLPSLEERLEAIAGLNVDLIISSAGVSVGSRDVVRTILDLHGGITFWRVNMRPGKPILFGQFENIPFIGLPGNPVSALVAFEVFVRPALAKLSGSGCDRMVVHAHLTHDVESDGRESYLRSVVQWRGNMFEVSLTGSQDSGMLSSLVQGNALTRIPAGKLKLSAGELVEIWLLDRPWKDQSQP